MARKRGKTVVDGDMEIPSELFGEFVSAERGERPSVFDLFRQAERDRHPLWEAAIRRARRNHLVFHGGLEGENEGQIIGPVRDRPPRKNQVRGLVKTKIARHRRDRRVTVVKPRNPEAIDVAGAGVANALLEFSREQTSYNLLMTDIHREVTTAGKAYAFVLWDPNAGTGVWAPKLDADGFAMVDERNDAVVELLGNEGDVVYERGSVADTWHDGPSIAASQYVWRERNLDIWTARAMVAERRGRSFVDSVDSEQLSGATRQRRKGAPANVVLVRELWARPTDRFPSGLYALVVGGVAAEVGQNPFADQGLPVAEWSGDLVDGTPYATTAFDDAVPVQLLINEREALKYSILQRSRPKRVGLANLLEQDDEGGDIVATDIGQVNQGIRNLDPPNPPRVVFDEQHVDVQALHDVIGVSALSSGREETKAGTSAKQVAFLTAADDEKSGDEREAGESFERALSMLALSRYAQFASDRRMVRVAGESRELDMLLFKRADLRLDFVFEPTSGLSAMRQNQGADAQQAGAAGAIPPAEAAERSSTGLQATQGQADERKRAWEMAQQALSGASPPPQPDIGPAVALEVLRAVAELSGNPGPLSPLIQYYQQRASANPAGAAPAGPAQPQQISGGQPAPGAPGAQ